MNTESVALRIPGVPCLWVSTWGGAVYLEVMEFSELAAGCAPAAEKGAGRCQAEPSCQTLPAQPLVFLLGQTAHLLAVAAHRGGGLPGFEGRRASALPPGGWGGLLTGSHPSPPGMVTASRSWALKVFSTGYPRSPSRYRWLCTRLCPLPGPDPGASELSRATRTQPRGRVDRSPGSATPGVCPTGPRGWDPLLPPAGLGGTHWPKRARRGERARTTAAGHSPSGRTRRREQGAGGWDRSASGVPRWQPAAPLRRRTHPVSPGIYINLAKFSSTAQG